MKKLLSLLSVLTISGTAVPTTIAASPYQKQETIKNSEINYQQANNLESLNRNKRSYQYYDDYGYQTRNSRGIAGTGFAQGVTNVLEQFKPKQRVWRCNTDHWTHRAFNWFGYRDSTPVCTWVSEW